MSEQSVYGGGVMEPAIVVGGARVFHGDCREVLRALPDNSIDSVVTDPPYELGFMGKKWDSTGIAYNVSVWVECLRVLKPGGHILAFGGSRTFHRMAVAIEDAGFEIRDSIAWISSKTFPKSLNVSKAIDKKLGAERVVTGTYRVGGNALTPLSEKGGTFGVGVKNSPAGYLETTTGGSDEAKQWEGWGTGLKNVVEPIVMGRKPLVGTVAANVLEYGVGGLNIDVSRVGTELVTINTFDSGAKPFGGAVGEAYTSRQSGGRWPANVILDEYSAGLLDEQSGLVKGGTWNTTAGARPFDNNGKPTDFTTTKVDNTVSGASRFFYCATASKSDRNEGLETPSTHPTVKPTTLMRYLIKLVTPAGGTVLDPFTGSGSTGKAALLDGYDFVGVELTEEYLPIIEGRLRWANEQEGETDERLF